MVLKVRVPQSRDVVRASTKGAAAYPSIIGTCIKYLSIFRLNNFDFRFKEEQE